MRDNLRQIIDSHAKGLPPGNVVDELRVLLDGASPDERKALKKLLWSQTDIGQG